MFHILAVFCWVQYYAPCTSVITVLHYYHIVLNFCQMNCVFKGYFLEFGFSENIFWVSSFSGKVYLGSSEIPNSADPCLYVFQVHPRNIWLHKVYEIWNLEDKSLTSKAIRSFIVVKRNSYLLSNFLFRPRFRPPGICRPTR